MVLPKPFKKYQKMDNNLEFQEIEVQNINTKSECDLITARYNFLLNEQPNLYRAKRQRFTSSLLGGCFSILLPVYLDFKDPFQDLEMLGIFSIGCFLIGAIITHAVGKISNDMNNQKALIQNIEMLQNWTRPIIVLPENRFDPSVDARAQELTNILNDEKCLNHLDIALENAQMFFEYSVRYGFRTGEKCQTNTGLPVVSLFPELFILRGAFDDKLWYEFQKEAVRIAFEIDNQFAKQWFAIESQTYRVVAGGQSMI
jgi:hypothetical protein